MSWNMLTPRTLLKKPHIPAWACSVPLGLVYFPWGQLGGIVGRKWDKEI